MPLVWLVPEQAQVPVRLVLEPVLASVQVLERQPEYLEVHPFCATFHRHCWMRLDR